MGYRTAAIGIVLGTIFLLVLLSRAGMSINSVLIYLALYFSISFAVTRLRAELGPPFHEIIRINPQEMMLIAHGTWGLGAVNMTILRFFYPFNRDNVAHPMPNQLEAFKIAEQTKMDKKKLLPVMLLSICISIIVAFWVYLHIIYKYGASAGCRGYIISQGWENFGQLSSWLHYPRGTDYPALGFIGTGAFFVVFLTLMRRRFIWWPFHPIGYAMATSWGISYMWAASLTVWIIKSIILRYGGLQAYRKGVPFFVGLVVGDYIVACVWSIVGAALGIPIYRFFS